ncbi:unnamed protein product (macronuclear) [Paramecium tetraurelia]|uniref:Chromosome undetermined scaffold_87, whole genome shotgun sequence n=1 Tax=Paramecium tetraurelia TaxID=5888 RepID=Q3SDE1_PARTE|nr:uncharacterized protein GSPATT00025293001 [Paramecium tetraurelia]CAI39417.1 EPI9 [Paramecium tetraurelia]CAK92559.1 unnamed protein product [Paramecium tetraurelia]|eukprot:XP_001459956.1 hypothetical protein (macronuclear) [Paramecium tetraurelia strain d4-2]
MSQLPQTGQQSKPQSNMPQQNIPQGQNQFIPQQGIPTQVLPQGQPQYVVPSQNLGRAPISGFPTQQLPYLQQQGFQPQLPSQVIGQNGVPYQTGPVQLSSQLMTEQAIKGESRIEYVPFERVITEYEEVRRQVQVPVTRQITDYYAVQYEVEYIPQVIQEKQIEYVPVERIQERTEYYTVQKQNILPAQPALQPQTLAQSQTIQTQRVQQQIVTQQPQQYLTIAQQPQVTTYQAPPVQTTTVIPQPPVQQPITSTFIQPPITTTIQAPTVVQNTIMPQTQYTSAYVQQPPAVVTTQLQSVPQTIQTTSVVPQTIQTTNVFPQTASVIPQTRTLTKPPTTIVQPQASVPLATTTVLPPQLAQTTTGIPSSIYKDAQRLPVQGNSLYRKTLPPIQPGQLAQTAPPQQIPTQPQLPQKQAKPDKDKTFLERLFE